MSTQKQKQSLHLFEGWAFTNKNYLIFALGLLLIFIGYVVMARGETYSFQSLTLAPILLFLGYVILIPLALIYRDKNHRFEDSSTLNDAVGGK